MIHKVINKIEALIEIQRRRAVTSTTLKKLQQDDDEAVRTLATVLDFINLSPYWTPEEQEALHGVKAIRNQYLASTETVTVKDFGSGDSGSKRTREQMSAGVESVSKIADICKVASSPEQWGQLIFKIIRVFKPNYCLELGTALGISASYQVSALKLNAQGTLITIEGSEQIARQASKTLAGLQYANCAVKVGRFNDVLPGLLTQNQPIDLAFIDGHHDREATFEYFEMIYPYLADQSILIFDDINWSEGMRDVWLKIFQDTRIKVSFDLYKWGICLVDKDQEFTKPRNYKLAL